MQAELIVHTHHPRFKDISGVVFGRLTAVKKISSKGRSVWECLCSCGGKVSVNISQLTSGRRSSCGCHLKEIPHWNSLHGATSRTSSPLMKRLYRVWDGMKERCFNKKHRFYADYGGRGIHVCQEWLNFENFWNDMSPSYKEGLCIERTDNDQGYNPTNCTWATRTDEARNRRKNRILTCNGESLCIAAWADKKGIPQGRIIARLHRGWSDYDAVFIPLRKRTK